MTHKIQPGVYTHYNDDALQDTSLNLQQWCDKSMTWGEYPY